MSRDATSGKLNLVTPIRAALRAFSLPFIAQKKMQSLSLILEDIREKQKRQFKTEMLWRSMFNRKLNAVLRQNYLVQLEEIPYPYSLTASRFQLRLRMRKTG